MGRGGGFRRVETRKRTQIPSLPILKSYNGLARQASAVLHPPSAYFYVTFLFLFCFQHFKAGC
jgi:hypothetical protein